jgi:hypothetical protein
MLVVVQPPESFEGKPDNEPEKHPYKSYVTQWGNDPTYGSLYSLFFIASAILNDGIVLPMLRDHHYCHCRRSNPLLIMNSMIATINTTASVEECR